MSHITRKAFIIVFAAVLLISGVRLPQKASAAYAPDFQAGNIIGNSLFFDGGSMNADQIQQFLNNQVPNCDTNGTQTSEYGGGTRAQYGASHGYPAPYICLRNYLENPDTHANNLGGVAPDGAWSAAQIIANAAITYSVSPKVLLVTLQKESTLVNDTWPFPSQYKAATGYGCPDSAPCDSQYYGFYNQVMNAARQFQLYATNPASYRYKGGQSNAIQYSPSASCGSSAVFIQNQATAGLYNYTPYQPDAAALNNLYGSGDSCSSYGNRNFWRMYTDWFGSTMGSDLVRSANDATVYLLSGANKYPIGDGNVLADYGPLGNSILYVSDVYLNAHTTGSLLGHMVGDSGGTLYFIDAGIKLPYPSCGAVAEYGYSCGSVITLTDSQINKFSTGPLMTSLYKTTSGKTFYVSSGTKREVFDQQSQTEAGITDAANVLLERGISYLPYGSPVIRDSVVVNDRGDGSSYLYDTTNFWELNGEVRAKIPLGSFPTGSLDDQSILGAQKKGALTGFVQDSTASNKYILLGDGKVRLSVPATWSAAYTQLSDQTLGELPTSTAPVNNQLVKSATSSTVYYAQGGIKRPISSWNDLLTLRVDPLAINTLLDIELNQLSTGSLLYGIGTMVKTNGSSTVYIVKGLNELLPISSFTYPQELGIPLVTRVMNDTDFQSYVVGSSVQSKLVCGGTYYVGDNGRLFSLSNTQMTQYGFNTSDFVDGGSLCLGLQPTQQQLTQFMRVPDGTIYLVQNGQKQAFTNYAAYVAHGGTGQNTVNGSYYFASLVVSGTNISQ